MVKQHHDQLHLTTHTLKSQISLLQIYEVLNMNELGVLVFTTMRISCKCMHFMSEYIQLTCVCIPAVHC